MALTQATLTNELGLDPEVAELFVNRRKPAKNEYWLNRSDYISLSTGYIFIPVFFDLLVKKGFDRTVILAENLLLTMEEILQSAGRMEYRMIDAHEHVINCHRALTNAGISKEKIQHAEANLVERPFKRIPDRFSALKRANTFLYTYAGQPVDMDALFGAWELLVPLMLMLDDFTDVKQDKSSGDENCLLEGNVAENFFELVACSGKLIEELSAVNDVLATYLKNLKDEAIARNMLTIMKMAAA